MKKKLAFAIIILAISLLMLTACSGGKIEYVKNFDMTEGIIEFEPKEITFAVASYNIQGGKLTKEKVSKISKLLNDNNVDIAGVQEMDNFAKRSGKINFMAQFSEEGFEEGYFAPTNTILMGKTYGVAVLSKTKLSKMDAFLLPYPFDRENKEVEKRIVSRILTTIDGVQIAHYNAHLSYEDIALSDGKSLRAKQIEYILELMKFDPSPYKILTGDFNVTSFSEYDAFNLAGYGCVNTSYNPLSSYRGEEGFLAIDNIIYTKNMQLLSGKMIDSDLTDHNPLIAKFTTAIA